jgi:hypothetical protein
MNNQMVQWVINILLLGGLGYVAVQIQQVIAMLRGLSSTTTTIVNPPKPGPLRDVLFIREGERTVATVVTEILSDKTEISAHTFGKQL